VTGQNGIAVIVKGAIDIVVVLVENDVEPLETRRVVVKAGHVIVDVEPRGDGGIIRVHGGLHGAVDAPPLLQTVVGTYITLPPSPPSLGTGGGS